MLRDLRYAFRVLLQAKGWTAVVLVSLALGIGANTALFSAVNGLLLQTIPVADPEGLVRLRWVGENDMVRSRSSYGYTADTVAGVRVASTFSYPIFEQLSASNETLVGMFACAPSRRLNVVVDGQAEIASGFLASGNYFNVLGVPALVGRGITPDDDRAAASPVIMISHAFWGRRFGLDPGVVGKVVTVNNTPVTIVGVLPPEHTGVQRPVDDAPDIHLPLTLDPQLGEQARLGESTYWWLQIMGRLKPGVTPEQVRGNLEGVFRAAARTGMDFYLEGLTAEQRSLSRNRDRTDVPRLQVDSGSRGVYDPSPRSTRQALILGAVVVLVLLIVCANVANLLLSRATARQKEIAVRLAVGATRARLVRQLMTESVVLATIGGGLGLVVAYAARQWLPFGQTAPFDWRVFAFASVLSLAAGFVFSLVPALRATRVDLSGSLKESGRSVARTRTLLSKALLVGQVAVSLVLLVGAGLFLKTLGNLRDVEVGFNPSNILLFRVDPGLNGYDEERTAAVYDRIAEGVRSIPGVRSVSLSQSAFLAGSTWTSTIHIQGSEASHGSHMMRVSPEFFETMEIPVLAGRVFDARDGKDAPEVVVINDAAAREYFGRESPLGRRFGFSPETRGEIEVVGVVRDVKYSDVRAAPPPTVYRSHAQSPGGSRTFEVRTAGLPGPLTAAVREAVQRVDPNLPLMDISTQAEQIERRFSQERLFARAYSVFGGLAMLLASIGLFGLASYNVAQRTKEIGIRMALGAEGSDVTRMVLRESLVLVGVGVGLGLVAVLVTGRLVASLLFELAPTDGLTIAQAVIAMVAAAALASYLPARRAARVDPLIALQYE